MRWLVVISFWLCCATTSLAEEYITDAFGVVPAGDPAGERALWADIDTAPRGVEDVLIFVGQKSLVAGLDVGHAVSLLLDDIGNLVSNGTQAEILLNGHPYIAATKNGVADVLYQPGIIAGVFDAGVSSGASQSARATYRVTPDLAGLIPALVAQSAIARPESFVKIKTDLLTDQYGNIAPSGVGAQMVLDHPDGSFSIMTPTVLQGQAQAHYLVRDVPDGGTLTGTVLGATSSPARFNVQDIAAAAPARVILTAIPDIRATRVSIGPVTTTSGYYLNDGANIRVTITGASGALATREGWLRDGAFETILTINPSDAPFEVVVETTLGTEVSSIPRNRVEGLE